MSQAPIIEIEEHVTLEVKLPLGIRPDFFIYGMADRDGQVWIHGSTWGQTTKDDMIERARKFLDELEAEEDPEREVHKDDQGEDGDELRTDR